MCSKKLSFFLTILLANFIRCSQIDFCMFDLSSSTNRFAYSIDPSNRSEEFRNIFESMIREDKISLPFERVFDESVDKLNTFNWYYNFGVLGRINISEILPSSLHCMFVYEQQLFAEPYDQPIVTAEAAVKFIFNEVIYQAEIEPPSHVHLPLLEISERQAVGCNFAKASSEDKKYFIVHCVQDGKSFRDKTLNSTKIIERSTRNEICVSDVKGVCDNTSDKMANTKIMVDVKDENELKKLISTMNCINCTIIMNVHNAA